MLTILQGDAIEQLRTLPDESVQTCVTSPPYWGLRDYGTAAWEGGVNGCDHAVRVDPRIESSTLGGGKESTGHQREGFKHECPRCGARRIDSQLGLEKTPAEYVAKMVEVFREVRRVLRKDGTLWLNLGASYAGGGNNRGNNSPLFEKQASNAGATGQVGYFDVPPGFKAKDLVPIPWMVAMALQADGWWLRSDIIWNKANCMPESVLDRPTRSHEYLLLLTKSARYYYDNEAIKEPASESDWKSRIGRANLNNKFLPTEELNGIRPRVKYTPNGKDKQRGHSRRNDGFNDRWDQMEKSEQCSGMRNKRSVWTVATAQYPEAHFATYPPDLIKPCIMAGSRPGDVILDPFAGSGTTGAVALELGRKAVLIELNPKYVELIEQRCNVTMGLARA